MLLVADVHGEFDALSRLARTGEPLLILGDLINYVDYRTLDGIAADVLGKEFVTEVARFRAGNRQKSAPDAVQPAGFAAQDVRCHGFQPARHETDQEQRRRRHHQ